MNNEDASLPESLRAELAGAMRRRDSAVVAVVRSAISALENAEALPGDSGGDIHASSPHIVGAARGLGAMEAARVAQPQEKQKAILAAEVAEVSAHVERLTRLCRWDEADGARRALKVLNGHLAPDRNGGGNV